MASPNAAGVAALVVSARPGGSALDVKSAIMASTEAKPDLAGKSVTGGRVNADRAVAGVLAGAPANVMPPVITGTPRQGVALGASSGIWNPPGTSYGYVWQRSFDGGSTWTAIVGATGSMYTPGASDIGASLRVTVTATNPYGVASATSAAVGPVASGAPVNTGPPVINGTRAPRPDPLRQRVVEPGRHVLPRTSGSARPTASTWTAIGANASTYTLTTADRETRVRVIVTATNAYGQASATSDADRAGRVGSARQHQPPTVTGTTQRTLHAAAGAGAWDGMGNTYAYKWQRDDGSGWTQIAGATASTYKLAKEDEGARVRVVVTASNADGTVELRATRRSRRSPRSRRPTSSRPRSAARRSAAAR